MNDQPTFVTETDFSVAWARAFLKALKPGTSELSTVVVRIDRADGSLPTENLEMRRALDQHLRNSGRFPTQTVANTIFPRSLWNPNASREELYRRYNELLPTLKKSDGHNKYGLYFERLVSFGQQHINQLEHIITTYSTGNHRRTALQASVFDPAEDHTNQRRRGFPCLQHIAFAPVGYDQLSMVAFYALQYLYDRAYGNYVGLWHLGQFVAQELGFRLVQLTCFANIAQLGEQKSRLIDLAHEVRTELDKADRLVSSAA